MNAEIANERSHVGRRGGIDPEQSAERRLKASAEKYYDPEVEIDWDAPPMPAMPWLSENRASLVGSELWDNLTTEQRREFGRQQLGTILIVGIWFEAALGVFLYHDLMVSPVASNRSRYLLTEISEEARHSTMFARVIDKMSEDGSPITYPLPRAVRGLLPLLSSLLPVGTMMFTATLMAEEVFDRLQREGMNDPALQPHARAAMRIHVIEEARHVAFAKEEIVRGYRDAGPLGRFMARMTAAMTAVIFPVTGLLNTQMYRAVGINPLKGFLAAFFGKQYRVNAQFLLGPIARYFYEAGLIQGLPAVLIWRLSRGLPDDVLTMVSRRHRRKAQKDGLRMAEATTASIDDN
ncbi:AurF N-oxygenase family protein [Mycobacteroides abscessus]